MPHPNSPAEGSRPSTAAGPAKPRNHHRFRRSKARLNSRSETALAPAAPAPTATQDPVKPDSSATRDQVVASAPKLDVGIQSVHNTPTKPKALAFETTAPVHTPSKDTKGDVQPTVTSSSKNAWKQGPSTPVPSSAAHISTASGPSSSVRANPSSSTAHSGEQEVPQEIINQTKAMLTFDEKRDGRTARPRICLDINNAGEDLLLLSNLPAGKTYDEIFEMVEPFGEVESLEFSTGDDTMCEVVYKDPSSLQEAVHVLDGSIFDQDHPAMKACLRSREPGAQIFVGDLTPDVTEAMLEQAFTSIVGSKVTAVLKRDPDTSSPIGYGFLSFQSEAAAKVALEDGYRIRVGNAKVRVGRAERNTHLYVTDLAPEVELDELHALFSKFGALVEEDTVIIRRSFAFVRFHDRAAAERAKRTLDKTDFHGRMTVRYAEAEPVKACITVQFHSVHPKAPGSIRDLLMATFSKYGNCSIEIPRLKNGQWRKVAYVTFHGEPVSATLAATEAVQAVRFVSTVPVCCQFSREFIPRVPPRDLRTDRLRAHAAGPRAHAPPVSGAEAVVNARLHVQQPAPGQPAPPPPPPPGMAPPPPAHAPADPAAMGMPPRSLVPGGPDMVAVYVPASVFHGMPMQSAPMHLVDAEYAPNPHWQGRAMPGPGAQHAHHAGAVPQRQW